ncbi:hypothetical protein [Streptomyces prunicolor]|uniref:Transposase n=1 Tax=Streptomyces prunicolor TaxID=67348 RepID=A0ABU4FM71_9ACTN|nr:hypothetical protein [Streptomyces prunicolor]MDV7221718.1 hypothetical protein [Streptomyces prunicolor]
MTLSRADLEAGVADDEVVGKKKRGPRAGGPKRRSFTPEYKLRIVEEYERLRAENAKLAAVPEGAGHLGKSARALGLALSGILVAP